MCVDWTGVEALHIVEVGEFSGPAIVWIRVEFGELSFEEGSVVAFKFRAFIDSQDVHNYHVEIRESRVVTLGTAGFYLSAGSDNKDDNKEYKRKNDSQAREDVVVLDISCVNESSPPSTTKSGAAEERTKLIKNVNHPKLVAEREAEQDLQKAL
ncbi:hypothetical protein BDN72DRAFT_839296 [Pluteus cervinus]|uniref:Uncharacterized protein n=1 Tax=Pluteus cervinus TaxID=181527 RepID=A0ACD3AXF4_9AGAR|nr:hypothetical protein BDN72DRAFT_839296 [Pluteus cervinus]